MVIPNILESTNKRSPQFFCDTIVTNFTLYKLVVKLLLSEHLNNKFDTR